jgi:mono/diheme cytochrome c family protein
MTPARLRGALAPLALLLLAGCQSGYDMRDQPRYKAYQSSALFPDSTSARPLPAGVIHRGESPDPDPVETGRDASGAYLQDIPFPVTSQLLARGRERFGIFCSPCHGLDAMGEGMVVARGFTPPPSLHTDSLRALPVGFLFEVMSLGFGRMPSYGVQVRPADRWAIAAYLRVLQLSRHMPVADLPPEARRKLEGGAP